MRNGHLVLLSMLGGIGNFGLLACNGKRLHAGDDVGSGGHAGAAGSIMPVGLRRQRRFIWPGGRRRSRWHDGQRQRRRRHRRRDGRGRHRRVPAARPAPAASLRPAAALELAASPASARPQQEAAARPQQEAAARPPQEAAARPQQEAAEPPASGPEEPAEAGAIGGGPGTSGAGGAGLALPRFFLIHPVDSSGAPQTDQPYSVLLGGASDDGAVLAGTWTTTTDPGTNFYWTEASGVVRLDPPSGSSRMPGYWPNVSSDGFHPLWRLPGRLLIDGRSRPGTSSSTRQCRR